MVAVLKFTLKVLFLDNGALSTSLCLSSKISIWFPYIAMVNPFSRSCPKLSRLFFIEGTYSTLCIYVVSPFLRVIITFPIPSARMVLLSANLTLVATFGLKSTSQSLLSVMWFEHPVSRYQEEQSSLLLMVTISKTWSESDPSSSCAKCA